MQSYENEYGLEVDTYAPKIFLREEFDISSSVQSNFVHKNNNLFGCIERKLWLMSLSEVELKYAGVATVTSS